MRSRCCQNRKFAIEIYRKTRQSDKNKKYFKLGVDNSIKRVYDAIIDFLYEFEKSNGFNDYWFDLDIHPQSRESKLYDMAVASVEKVELVLKKEYCFLGKTKIYIELMDFVYNDLYDIFDGKLSYAYRFEAIVDGNPTTSDDYYKTLNKINEIIEKYVDFSK